MTTFDQLLGEHRRANIEGEIAAVIGAFTAAMLSAFDAEDPGAAMRENLDQFETELGAALPKWAAGEGVLKGVPIERIRKMRDGIEKVLRDAGEDVPETPTREEETMTPTTMLKTRSAVMMAATEIAKSRLAADPSLGSLPAARARVWRERTDLADRYNELPIEKAGAPPVRKDAGPAMREATREAQELMKSHPGKYGSIATARREVYKADPELAERVSNEQEKRAA